MRTALAKWSTQPWLQFRLCRRSAHAARWNLDHRYYRYEAYRSFATSSALHYAPPTVGDQSHRSHSEVHRNAIKSEDNRPLKPPADWDENPDLSISSFQDLPSANFGVNQHMIINAEFKEALRQILWKFRAPIRYAFAYGSGVFPQSAKSSSGPSTSVHANPSKAVTNVQGQKGKMIDFIFGVSYTEHWHSLNLTQHRDHYSALGSLGSGLVKRVQDSWGAGVYFNPFVTVNGTLIKYGVVNLDTLCTDLSEWTTLYLAGRLHKPVKILRDDPRVRLANQINLISAVRTALLLLPEKFTEKELYTTIASLSYLGDPRMRLPTEDRNKVANIVDHQMTNFRHLYAPLIQNLPNIDFTDSRCKGEWADDASLDASLEQDMDPVRRGNMVRRLPKAFRSRLYFRYQSKFQIPGREFSEMMEQAKDEDSKGIKRQQGGKFERRIGSDEPASLNHEVSETIRKTSSWPATSQSIKSFFTAGIGRSWRYMSEKQQKYREGQKMEAEKKQPNRAKQLTGAPPDQKSESAKSEGGKQPEQQQEAKSDDGNPPDEKPADGRSIEEKK